MAYEHFALPCREKEADLFHGILEFLSFFLDTDTMGRTRSIINNRIFKCMCYHAVSLLVYKQLIVLMKVIGQNFWLLLCIVILIYMHWAKITVLC